MLVKLFSVMLIALSVATASHAASIEIAKPWAQAQADVTKPGAIFLTIINRGDADKLVSISTPAAKVAQIHNSKMKRGKMRMRRKAVLDVGAKTNVDLSLGGLHIMLTDLASPLQSGEKIR